MRSTYIATSFLAAGLLIGLGLAQGLSSPSRASGATESRQNGWATSKELVAEARKDLLAYNLSQESDPSGFREVMAWRLAELVFRGLDPVRFFRLSTNGQAPLTTDQVLETGAGICGHASEVLASAYAEAGIPHRFIRIWSRHGDSHVALEFQDTWGNWNFVDPIYGLIIGKREGPHSEPTTSSAMDITGYLNLPTEMRAVSASCFQQVGINPTVPAFIGLLDSAECGIATDSNGQLFDIYSTAPKTLPNEIVVEIEDPL